MGGHGRYAKGHNALGHCGQCGKKMLLRKMVYDGQIPDLLVCPECYDPRHPQEYLPAISDPVTLYDPTGDLDNSSNIVNISLDQITTKRQRSVGEASSIPVQDLPIGVNPYSAIDRLVYNPLQVLIQIGASRFQLKVSQDPAELEFTPDIPPPSGNIIAMSSKTSNNKPLILFSEDDQAVYLDTDFDAVGGDSVVGFTKDVTWDTPNNRWVAVTSNATPPGTDIWTCDDATITASSVWTPRTPPYEETNSTIGSTESANGVIIHAAGGLSGPNRIGIMRSSDGGINWTDETTAASINNGLYTIRYRKDNEWWGGGGNGQLVRSTDNGLTWVTGGFAFVAGGANIHGIEYTDRVVAGDRGRIHVFGYVGSFSSGVYYSDDNAASWTKAAQPNHIHDNMGNIRVNPNTGTLVFVGADGWILRSTNNGLNYTRITGQITATHDIHRLIYQDNVLAPYGFVAWGIDTATSEGVIWSSIDDGVTWVQRVSDTSLDPNGTRGLASADEHKHDQNKDFGV